MLYHHVHTAARPLTELRPAVPKVLGNIVMACLKKEPSDRPTSEQILKMLKK